jgi:hypothetical protein
MWRRPENKGGKALVGVRFSAAAEPAAAGAPSGAMAKKAEV